VVNRLIEKDAAKRGLVERMLNTHPHLLSVEGHAIDLDGTAVNGGNVVRVARMAKWIQVLHRTKCAKLWSDGGLEYMGDVWKSKGVKLSSGKLAESELLESVVAKAPLRFDAFERFASTTILAVGLDEPADIDAVNLPARQTVEIRCQVGAVGNALRWGE
jgi:hypothetical protein